MHHHQKGFSLIEIILYTTLTSISMLTLLAMTYHMVDSSNRLSQKIIIEQESNFLFQKIKSVLNNVDQVLEPTPTLLTSLQLQVQKVGSPDIFTMRLNGSNIELQQGSAPFVALNSKNVKVTGLLFTYLPAGAGFFHAIKADMTVDGKAFSYTFYLIHNVPKN